MAKITQNELKKLMAKAREKDIKAYMDLREVYSTSDMPFREFIAHLRIIAEGKEH